MTARRPSRTGATRRAAQKGARRVPQRPARPVRRSDALATRAALLSAAGRIFAREGYRAARVREICAAAGVNIGAINRHFGSKAALYREVVVQSHRELVAREPPPRFAEGQDPADALRALVGYLLRLLLLRRPRHPYAGALMMHELQDPSPALDELAARVIRPMRDEIARIVGALLAEADCEELRLRGSHFVLGVCVFQQLGRPILIRLGARRPTRPKEVAALAGALLPLLLGGIDGLRRGRGAARPS